MDVEMKDALNGIRDTVQGFGSRISQIQTQVDSLDLQSRERHVGSDGREDLLKKAFDDSQEFARLREVGKGKAAIRLDMKTLISSTAVGYGVSGVLEPERVGPIVPMAQRRLFMRDLLSRGNRVTGSAAYFIQETAFTNNASPQAGEGSTKAESADTFATVSRPVITLSHWIPASRQVLDDLPALLAFIKTKLLFGLRSREDLQCLAGDGTGQNLTGLTTSAAPFNTALMTHPSAGWTNLDVLRRALQQVEQADEIPSGFFVLNPRDWADLNLLRDGFGRFIIGDPADATVPQLWGKPVVVTTAMGVGTFLCGSSEGAELLDRMDATVELSTEFSDYFVRNLVAILCECREVLCIYRPNSFVYGSLVSSPQ
jgi:HK97 family phage major capsid protein